MAPAAAWKKQVWGPQAQVPGTSWYASLECSTKKYNKHCDLRGMLEIKTRSWWNDASSVLGECDAMTSRTRHSMWPLLLKTLAATTQRRCLWSRLLHQNLVNWEVRFTMHSANVQVLKYRYALCSRTAPTAVTEEDTKLLVWRNQRWPNQGLSSLGRPQSAGHQLAERKYLHSFVPHGLTQHETQDTMYSVG